MENFHTGSFPTWIWSLGLKIKGRSHSDASSRHGGNYAFQGHAGGNSHYGKFCQLRNQDIDDRLADP